MRIIEPKSEYLNADDVSAYQFMEKAGRTCYKSENNITEDSAVRFVQGLKKSGHTAMLEHSHIILLADSTVATAFINAIHDNDITECNTTVRLSNFFNISRCRKDFIISGSFRAFLACYQPEFLDNLRFSDINGVRTILNALHNLYPEIFDLVWTSYAGDSLDHLVSPLSRQQLKMVVRAAYKVAKEANYVISKHLTHTVIFTCDRGITHEFVRHRLASFAQESTRYCNYSKDKFGNEITVIRPDDFKEGSEEYEIWKDACEKAEENYFKLINLGVKAQLARDVLPTSVKTELIITATEEEWQHIINLRYHGTTGAPHPQIVQSMSLVYDDLVEKSEHRLY